MVRSATRGKELERPRGPEVWDQTGPDAGSRLGGYSAIATVN